MQVPGTIALPSGMLELVLHVEQPHARSGREQDYGEMHEQERLDADEPDKYRDN
jgi:hypothetical protein